MKVRLAVWSVLMLGIVGISLQPLHGAPSKKESLIGQYAGRYSGSVSLTQTGIGTVFGSAQATFQASKKKENGSLTLFSTLSASGTTTAVQETLTFHGRSFTYVLSASGSAVVGQGKARVSKKAIHYSATIFAGGSSAFVVGTIKLKGRKLVVNHQLSSSSFTAVFLYQLKRHGK